MKSLQYTTRHSLSMGSGRNGHAMNATRARTANRTAAVSTLVACLAWLAMGAGPAQAAIGDAFSFAPVTVNEGTAQESTAPAFPGETAFWAGVCDLYAGASSTLTPTPAAGRFPDCIEQPASFSTENNRGTQMVPPLAPGQIPNLDIDNVTGDGTGSGVNGWLRRNDFFLPILGPSWRLADVTQAGGRPDGSASFWFSRSPDQPRGLASAQSFGPDGQPRDIRVSLPPGVIGNPNAVPKCPAEAMKTSPSTCPPKSQVGVTTLAIGHVTSVLPVYNAEPRRGKTAELLISGAGLDEAYKTNAPVVAEARTDGDFGVDAFATDVPSAVGLHGQTFTIWGVPWAASHDRYRTVAGYCGAPSGSWGNTGFGGGMPVSGLEGGFGRGCSQEPQSYDPSWGTIKPFLTTQTECSPANPVTSIWADNWHTTKTAAADSVAPLVDGCEDIRFPLSFGLATTSAAADSATGLEVDLSVAQNNDPPFAKRFNNDDADLDSAVAHWKSTAGLASSHLKDSFVTLPAGVSVNPSSATGLAGCSDSEVGVTDGSSNPLVFNNGDPFNKDNGADGAECPDGSIIGTATVSTPLLDEELSGEVVLGSPHSTDPLSGRMFRMFLVVRNRERGLVAKIHGTATADPASGQLKATFANNPQVPFDNLKLSFKGGLKGLLATQRACDSRGWSSTFVPWSASGDVAQSGQFATNSNCANGFAPGLDAGMDTKTARSNGTFSFRFGRQDGEQYLRGLTTTLPKGLLASVRDLPLCTNAQAAAAACPAGSKIGVVDARAGAGDPFVLEEKGEVFLTEGYKGGAYGLAVKVRPVAGPFRGAMELSPILVRQAIYVDRKTAQVTAISDPFPLIHHGVPLRVREVTVLVNRPQFMLNPSDCSQKQIDATLASDQGASAGLTNGFQAIGCPALAFKPKLALRLTGRKQVKTGKHPGIRATVTQNGIPEAGIAKAEVRLPKSLALDVDNAQALCEFADGTRPDLENHCPEGSIVGRARAASPLLNDPLVGNVYFVKNVRRSSSGNLIRTLPMIVLALRGEIAVNLVGESNVKNGKLVNTFDEVPDAPISRFNLNINGGKNGILAVTRTRRTLINLCATGRQIAEADMDGQNGRRHDFDINMKKPCAKKSKKAAAKRKAAAKQRNAAARRRAARG
jgi:hypothetical protein